MTKPNVEHKLKEFSNKAGRLLIKKKNTIAVAESVTAGNLQAVFSLAKDATAFFQGGITAYNIGQKCRHLLVEPTHAIECNCVSKIISDKIAVEVCNLFCSDYGIGITGYASPVPEENINKLFAHLSIANNNKALLSKKISTQLSDPREVQLFYTQQALKMLISVLSK